MKRRGRCFALFVCCLLPVLAAAGQRAAAEDRVVSIGDSSLEEPQAGMPPPYGKLVEVVRALDRATGTTSRITVLPFARSLSETAAGRADFHIPFIQSGGLPPPPGLAFVPEVDFGEAQFVVYSRRADALDSRSVAAAREVETEPGHEDLFPFPVHATYCVPCSLDKMLLGRSDALIVSSEIVDPLLHDPKYRGLHRAPYRRYPLRALVPAGADSSATRRFLEQGLARIKASGELWRILHSDRPYADWQP